MFHSSMTEEEKIFTIYNNNTLHGFNPHVKDGFFLGIILEYIPREVCEFIRKYPDGKQVCHMCPGCDEYRKKNKLSNDDLEKKIRTESAVNSVEIWPTYGGDCLKIARSDRFQIKKVIDITLKNNVLLRLQTRLEPVYHPGETFSIETSELKAIPMMLECLNDSKLKWILKDKSWLYGDKKLWKTKEGQKLAEYVVREYNVKEEELYILDLNTFIEDIDYPILSKVSSEKKEQNKEGNDTKADDKIEKVVEECMVCFNAEPDTIVKPCNHQVVCRACAPQLLGTNDEKICLYCRSPITKVEYP